MARPSEVAIKPVHVECESSFKQGVVCRGVKTGQPGPFWPGPFLARIKRAGLARHGKTVCVSEPGPPVFSHLYNLWPNQILIFFISNLVD